MYYWSCLKVIFVVGILFEPDEAKEITTVPKQYYSNQQAQNRLSVAEWTTADSADNLRDNSTNTNNSTPGQRNPYMTITYAISEVFILATFLLYIFSSGKQNRHRPVLMCHLISVFYAYLIIIIRRTVQVCPGTSLCFFIGIGHQFFFLGSFLWLSVLAFHFWRRFRSLQTMIHRDSSFSARIFFRQTLFTVGVSSAFCFVTLCLDWADTNPKPDIYGTCSISNFYLNLCLFYGPIGLLLLINLVLCGMTMTNIRRMKRQVANVTLNSQSTMFRFSFHLILIMGLQWIICYVSKIVSVQLEETQKYWDALETLNGLQGICIFLVYVSTMRKMKETHTKECRWRKTIKTLVSIISVKPKDSKKANIAIINNP